MVSQTSKLLVLCCLLSLTIITDTVRSREANADEVLRVGYFKPVVRDILDKFETNEEQALRKSAEDRLRKDVGGCGPLHRVEPEKRSREEIERMSEKLQREIEEKLQALKEAAERRRRVRELAMETASRAIAVEKHLDLIIEESKVMVGHDKLLNCSEDVSEAILRRLQKLLSGEGLRNEESSKGPVHQP